MSLCQAKHAKEHSGVFRVEHLCNVFASVMAEFALAKVGKVPAFKGQTNALQTGGGRGRGWGGRGGAVREGLGAFTKFQAA